MYWAAECQSVSINSSDGLWLATLTGDKMSMSFGDRLKSGNQYFNATDPEINHLTFAICFNEANEFSLKDLIAKTIR